MNALVLAAILASHTLHWDAPKHHAHLIGYVVYALSKEGERRKLDTLPKTATSYTVRGEPGDCFQVSALHGKRESAGIKVCL
jgi:hypothetical protein